MAEGGDTGKDQDNGLHSGVLLPASFSQGALVKGSDLQISGSAAPGAEKCDLVRKTGLCGGSCCGKMILGYADPKCNHEGPLERRCPDEEGGAWPQRQSGE